MYQRVRLWLLLITGALLLVGATLVSGAEQPTGDECDPASAGQGDGLAPSVAGNGVPEADLALLQAAGEGCLDCHADQERVKELAVEEETGEKLSEGPG
ncbi:MAG: hypothetical protein OZ934_14995 [Anaerolineae bacterium]|nr:hypothetical protein [Anaerolineae bacterium]